jgi:hypothetical protein
MSRKKLPAISSEGPTGDKAPRTIEYKVGSIDASGVREDRLVPVQLMVTKTTHTKVAAPPKHPATIDLEPADQSRPPTEMEAPVPSARQLRCSECGEIAEAACDCGAPYLPAGARAAEAIAKHPEKSDRAIAAEAGVNRRTVVRARKQLVHSAPVAEQRIGLDGKKRKQPKRKLKIVSNGDEMPSEEEAHASWQRDVYDQACFLLERMESKQRQKFFAFIKRKYSDEI